MKKYFFVFILLIVGLSFTSCKTSEANYRAAYQIAKNKHNAEEGVDRDTYDKIVAEQTSNTAVVSGDSVRLVQMHVNVVDDDEQLQRPYGVVVGEYKQPFNARSFRDRLKQEDKPAYVVMDGERVYYVIARAFDTSREAAEYLRRVRDDVQMRIPIEKPWILFCP